MSRAVHVEDVSVRLGSTQALSGVSFSVEQGTLAAIIGPSGSGKSTLVRVLTGTLTPDSGEVGVTSGASPSAVRVGLVPQLESATHALPLSVAEVVAVGRPRFGLRTRSNEKRQVTELLDLLGLAGLQTRTLLELSGGQRQRVAIARAMMSGAEVLVCDEPTSGADPVLANDVMDALQALSSQGVTIVVATHDLERVARRCDLMLALRDGKPVFLGDPATFTEADFDAIYGTARKQK